MWRHYNVAWHSRSTSPFSQTGHRILARSVALNQENNFLCFEPKQYLRMYNKRDYIIRSAYGSRLNQLALSKLWTVDVRTNINIQSTWYFDTSLKLLAPRVMYIAQEDYLKLMMFPQHSVISLPVDDLIVVASVCIVRDSCDPFFRPLASCQKQPMWGQFKRCKEFLEEHRSM